MRHAKEGDRAWLHKIRAYWGHHYHFHVRIACPGGSTNCEAQPPLPSDDGCGKELTNWLALVKPKPKPPTPPETVAKPAPPKPGITLDQLPADCRTVLSSGAGTSCHGVQARRPARYGGSQEAYRDEIGAFSISRRPEARAGRARRDPAAGRDIRPALPCG